LRKKGIIYKFIGTKRNKKLYSIFNASLHKKALYLMDIS